MVCLTCKDQGYVACVLKACVTGLQTGGGPGIGCSNGLIENTARASTQRPFRHVKDHSTCRSLRPWTVLLPGTRFSASIPTQHNMQWGISIIGHGIALYAYTGPYELGRGSTGNELDVIVYLPQSGADLPPT